MEEPIGREALVRGLTDSWSRRAFLKRSLGLGAVVSLVPGLLAACATVSEAVDEEIDDSSDDTEPTEPDDPAVDEEPDDDDDEPEEIQLPETGGIINANTTLGDAGISNPILAGSDYWTDWLTFSRLLTFDDEGEILFDLAENYEFSDDGLTLSIGLHEAQWHDGEAFTSEDVTFTFSAVQNEATESPLASRLRVGGAWVEWDNPDERTVEITMSEVFAPFLESLSHISIIPHHLLDGVEDINTDDFNTNPIGTGPYRFVERVPDQFVRYERFVEYFQGPAAAEGWTVYYMPDATAGTAALDSGEIDMLYTPPELHGRYEDDDAYHLLQYVFFTPITLSFNHRHPALEDLPVRQAIAHAIDRQSLSDSVTRGRGLLANNQYAETGPLDQYNDYENVNYGERYSFDPERARELLDEAGWISEDDQIRERDGQPLSLTLLTYAGFEEYQNAQVIIQQMLADVGIEVVPEVLEFTTLLDLWYDPESDPEDRAMEVQEWPHPFEQDPDVYDELHSDNFPPGENFMWFADDEMDQLIEEGRRTLDPDQRVGIYHQLDQRRLETLPALPLYCARDAWVVRTTIQSRNEDHPLETTPSFRWYQRAFAADLYKDD